MLTESGSKELEFPINHHIVLVGCYGPPSALGNSLSTLGKLLCAGDLNWDWLMPASDSLKATFELCLFKIAAFGLFIM